MRTVHHPEIATVLRRYAAMSSTTKARIIEDLVPPVRWHGDVCMAPSTHPSSDDWSNPCDWRAINAEGVCECNLEWQGTDCIHRGMRLNDLARQASSQTTIDLADMPVQCSPTTSRMLSRTGWTV